MEQLLWHLLAGTRGGPMRARILLAIKRRPANTRQVAQALGIDYKTAQHHLEVLLEHQIVTVQGKYGATYFLAEATVASWPKLASMWVQFGKTDLKKDR